MPVQSIVYASNVERPLRLGIVTYQAKRRWQVRLTVNNIKHKGADTLKVIHGKYCLAQRMARVWVNTGEVLNL